MTLKKFPGLKKKQKQTRKRSDTTPVYGLELKMQAAYPLLRIYTVMESEGFWQTVQRLEESSGPGVALGFIIFFAILYFGIAFLAAWAVSVTLGTSYWMTLLSIVALKFALK